MILKRKSLLALLTVLVLLLAGSCTSSLAESAELSLDPCGLRSWNLDAGYQYVIMGYYPY